MLTHLFNYIYNDCQQLLSFSWREKRNTEGNNDLGARKQDALHKLKFFIFPEFSGKSLTSWDSKSCAITQIIHTNVVGLFCDAGWINLALKLPVLSEMTRKSHTVHRITWSSS